MGTRNYPILTILKLKIIFHFSLVGGFACSILNGIGKYNIYDVMMQNNIDRNPKIIKRVCRYLYFYYLSLNYLNITIYNINPGSYLQYEYVYEFIITLLYNVPIIWAYSINGYIVFENNLRFAEWITIHDINLMPENLQHIDAKL